MSYFLRCLFLCLLCAGCQYTSPERENPAADPAAGQPSDSFQIDPGFRQLYEQFEQFREPAITHRRFKHKDIEPLITRLQTPFEVQQLGASVEGRAIYEVQVGEGPTSVLLWSQMHGDEPTATMAIMDIFNFFQASGDGFDSLRQRLRSELSLHFIPMLNPDGAEVYERRNALGIDLNRDARRMQSPESKILKAARDRTKADWGFNLHDQNRYYAAGQNPQTASISFLAPAYNAEKEVNEKRGDAMQLIVLMNRVLQHYISGKVARYDDAFEPRAFGDNIQKWGTRTILVESGGLEGDPEKQYSRRLHFTMLLSALNAIATGNYEAAPREAYEEIPYNAGGDYHDLLLRAVEQEYEGNRYTIDLAFRHREVGIQEDRNYYLRAGISDIGDLTGQYGYQELQADGYRIVTGKTYPEVFEDYEALQAEDIRQRLREGYTTFQLKKRPPRLLYHRKPVEIVAEGKSPANEIRLYGNPSFLLEKNGQMDYAVINGFVYYLAAPDESFNL